MSIIGSEWNSMYLGVTWRRSSAVRSVASYVSLPSQMPNNGPRTICLSDSYGSDVGKTDAVIPRCERVLALE